MTPTSASHPEPESAQSSITTPALETAVPTTVSPAEPVVPLVTAHVPQNPPASVGRTKHLGAIAVAGVAFLVVAALALPRHSSAPGSDAGAAASQPEPLQRPAGLVGSNAEPAVVREAPITASGAETAAVAPGAVSVPSKKTLVPKAKKNRIAGFTTSEVPIAPVADLAFNDDSATKLPGSEGIVTPAPASISTGTGGTPVTITGCLETSVDRDDFRLTDTEGVDAPRSRSWRTGFLKKRSAPVALVEPLDRLALQSHVGRRVAATGLLTSHDLRVNELRDVGSACN
jgi:hypothetical protein